MHYLHVTVYQAAGHDISGHILNCGQAPWMAEWQLPIDPTPTLSVAFPTNSFFIMVKADTGCCLAFGPDPEAEDGVHPLDPGEIRWYGVTPGHHLSVIESTR